MSLILQDTSMVFTDPAIPTLQVDAMIRTGALHLFDFNDYPACNPSNTRPSVFGAGVSFANLISGQPAALTSGTTTRNADVTVDGANGIRVYAAAPGGFDLGGSNYDVYNKAWVKLLWFKQVSGHSTATSQGMSHRSNGGSGIGSMQHAIFMADGGDHLMGMVGNNTALVSYDMGVTELNTVTQCGIAYNPATGIMQAIKNGVIVGSVALTGGGNLAQPSGTVIDRIGKDFGPQFDGFMYRQYTEDLTASGASVADVAMLDYLSMAGRFV